MTEPKHFFPSNTITRTRPATKFANASPRERNRTLKWCARRNAKWSSRGESIRMHSAPSARQCACFHCNEKAYFRAAKAYFELQQYSRTIAHAQCVQKGQGERLMVATSRFCASKSRSTRPCFVGSSTATVVGS